VSTSRSSGVRQPHRVGPRGCVCIAEWAWLDRRVTSSESWIPGHLSLRSCEEKETTMPMVNEEVALPGATLSTYRSGQAPRWCYSTAVQVANLRRSQGSLP